MCEFCCTTVHEKKKGPLVDEEEPFQPGEAAELLVAVEDRQLEEEEDVGGGSSTLHGVEMSCAGDEECPVYHWCQLIKETGERWGGDSILPPPDF